MPVRHSSWLLLLAIACAQPAPARSTGADRLSVQADVRQLAEQISLHLARRGPMAWVDYFHRSPGFFMASDGQLIFASNAGADSSMITIARVLRRIDLIWIDLRIDSLAPDLAVMASRFTEALTDSAGHTQQIAGYFTAVAERGDSAWQLRNLHWSLVHPQNTR